MERLLTLAPPGIDELAAVIEVTDALESAADLIVMDTAPSGHALRLLEMPGLVQEWTRALMAILLKYQPVAGIGELGAALIRVSQGLGRLRALLADERRCAFIVVTRAAALPREESGRLIARLAAMRVRIPLVLVNAMGSGTCASCRRIAAAETRELRRNRAARGAHGAARRGRRGGASAAATAARSGGTEAVARDVGDRGAAALTRPALAAPGRSGRAAPARSTPVSGRGGRRRGGVGALSSFAIPCRPCISTASCTPRTPPLCRARRPACLAPAR